VFIENRSNSTDNIIGCVGVGRIHDYWVLSLFCGFITASNCWWKKSFLGRGTLVCSLDVGYRDCGCALRDGWEVERAEEAGRNWRRLRNIGTMSSRRGDIISN